MRFFVCVSFAFAFLCTFFTFSVHAQILHNAPQKSLVVMNVAAHPDDEDGQTLTYYRKAKNAVAYSVIYTRGEGGQNEIGKELYQALGAIRTIETEKAARILGTKVFSLNYQDFGFSKHATEAFAKWGGRETVTTKIVYMIRKLKPDVIFTNHDTVTVAPNRQHGQHQAVGISVYDAFALANNPNYHPEQLQEEGVTLWQPKRLFWRSYTPTGKEQVKIAVGDMSNIAGKSYQNLAMDALKEHASQGMDMFVGMRNLPSFTAFTLIRSATDAALDPTDLAGNLPPINRQPELHTLIDAGFLPQLPESTFQLSDDIATAGQLIKVKTALKPQGALKIFFDGVPIPSQITSDGFSFVVPTNALPSYPKVSEQYNRITNNFPVTYAFEANRRNSSGFPLKYVGYLPLEIAPDLYIEPISEMVRLKQGVNTIPLKIHVFSKRGGNQPFTISIKRGATTVSTANVTIGLHAENTIDFSTNFDLQGALPLGDYTIQVTTPTQTLLTQPARVIEAHVLPNLKVGIIKSYDDTMEQAMKELGVSYKMLDSLDLAKSNFDGLNTIVVDIRAYLKRKDLRIYNQNVLDWVKNGGYLMVNYQKTFEWNEGATDPTDKTKKNPLFAPFPLTLSSKRITYEDAPVTVLQPNSPIFKTQLNAITSADWDGWVQERGLYFPEQYDAHYQELFSMNDPGEAPLRGSTLLAPYGKGMYLYTSLVWYRQLKMYHQGAYKVFANMLNLPLLQQ